MTFYGDRGVVSDTWKRNVDFFHDAYVAQLADFATCVHRADAEEYRGGRPGGPGHRPRRGA
jgi:hypothetical protein